jgi:hypothetical protein
MFGLSSSGKQAIAELVEEMFDQLALQFIGALPSVKGRKALIISGRRHYGLPELFVQAMSNRAPNEIEQDTLRSFLESANGYVDSLKSKAKTNVAERIDALARESRAKKEKFTKADVQEILDEELGKAKSHLKAIAESESTKLRNVGTLMNISRIAANLGDDDPTVFFIVVKDDVTCEECKRLHLMPDGSTPRLWKFSELSQGYHKRGENSPSVFGLHPHCRCTLTYLSQGFGFDKSGRLKYQAENYDAHSKQNKK